MTKKPVLGRGISAMLPDADVVNPPRHKFDRPTEVPVKQEKDVNEIKISDIEANPSQPRTHFDEEALKELTESIKTIGLIQPVTVRETEAGRYQIISGERRYRAAKVAGLTTIPVYIRKADDKDLLEMALVENIQREDLDAIEIAISFQRLIDECSLTQESLSERVGKKRATVANYLRLLRLPPQIQLFIRNRKLSMGHARAIVGVDDEKLQLKIARKTIDEELSVRQVETLIKKSLLPVPKKQAITTDDDLPEDYFRLIDLLGSYFNNNINI
jgi:ParB family chromosome partitioning protein